MSIASVSNCNDFIFVNVLKNKAIETKKQEKYYIMFNKSVHETNRKASKPYCCQKHCGQLLLDVIDCLR